MKSKLFLIVLLLAVITTIGISQDKQSQSAKVEAALAEQARIYKLPLNVQSLVGIKGIYVAIEELKEHYKSSVLTREQLKTDVELKLRLAGIKVNSREESIASEDGVYLYVNINGVSNDDSAFIVHNTSIDLKQNVMLLRSPFIMSIGAATWNGASAGMCVKSDFPEEARKAVKEQMDRFINDYLTANPKK